MIFFLFDNGSCEKKSNLFCNMSGSHAVPGTQAGSASAAPAGRPADLVRQWWRCHRMGRASRRSAILVNSDPSKSHCSSI